jgi:hypothetical protein
MNLRIFRETGSIVIVVLTANADHRRWRRAGTGEAVIA